MKQKKLLILLLIALLGAAGYAIWYDPYQEVAPVARSGSGKHRSQTTAARKPGPHELALKLELLERREGGYAEVKRDIFHYYVPPPAPAPPPPAVKKPIPSPPPPVEKVAPPPLPPQPMVAATRFTYLGMLEKGAEKRVFLAAGDDLYVVREGMQFGKEGQYLVENLTEDEISIRQQGRPTPTRVALRDPENSQALPGLGGATSGGSSPTLQRKVPPIRRPQLKSFKRYQP